MNLSDFFTGSETTLASIIIPLVTGVIIAAGAVLFNKQIIGKFVKRLFDENADSEQNAKTLEELGFQKNRILRYSLRDGSTLRKVVMASPVSNDEEEKKTPPRYYIPEEHAYRAEVIYNPDGSSVLTILIAIIMFIAVTLLLLVIIPDLIQMASNAINKFKTL